MKKERKELQPIKLQDIKTTNEKKIVFLAKWGWYKLVVYFKPFLRPSFLICYGMGWFCTNGVFYLGVGLGVLFHKPKLVSILLSWCAFLWLPTTCEGVITLPIALYLHSVLFKNDLKCKADLDRMYKEAIHDVREVSNKMREKTNWYDLDKVYARAIKKTKRIERKQAKIKSHTLGILSNGWLKEQFRLYYDMRYSNLVKRLDRLNERTLDKVNRKKSAKITYDHYKEVESGVNTQNKGENTILKAQNIESSINTQHKQ